MKLINSLQQFATVRNWITKGLVALVAIALMWQSSLPLNGTAMAAPSALMATTAANQAKGAADDVREGSKELIRDTKKTVERAANSNASKVDRADDEGGFFERKAQRDQARIEKRASEDAARTEKAVDNSMNAVQGAVEKVKGVFGG